MVVFGQGSHDRQLEFRKATQQPEMVCRPRPQPRGWRLLRRRTGPGARLAGVSAWDRPRVRGYVPHLAAPLRRPGSLQHGGGRIRALEVAVSWDAPAARVVPQTNPPSPPSDGAEGRGEERPQLSLQPRARVRAHTACEISGKVRRPTSPATRTTISKQIGRANV